MKKGIIQAVLVFGIFGVIFKELLIEKEEYKELNNKLGGFYGVLVQWVKNKQKDYCLSKWFKRRGYYHIAVYGGKEMGELLVNELKGTGVVVDYIIDRNKEIKINGLKVYKPEDILPVTDTIIVTAINSYEEICTDLSKRVNCPIWSIEDVVNRVGEEMDYEPVI